MAKCKFPDGIGLVSGTISKKTHIINGQRVTTRVVAKVHNGKQRLYIREEPDFRPSQTPQAVAARNLFSEASAEAKRRAEAGDTRPRRVIFKEVYAQLKNANNHGTSDL